MVDYVVTNTAVVASDNAVKESGLAGETIAAGKAVYKSPTTKKWMLADSNSATAAVIASLFLVYLFTAAFKGDRP